MQQMVSRRYHFETPRIAARGNRVETRIETVYRDLLNAPSCQSSILTTGFTGRYSSLTSDALMISVVPSRYRPKAG